MTTLLAEKDVRVAPMAADLSEEYLARRFARLVSAPETITYEVTRDIGLLHQYQLLREQMFIHSWGMKSATAAKDAHDDQSEIMIARIGKQCIGGCRITFSNAGKQRLPLETQGFSLSQSIKDLPLSDVSYVEISRMVMLPEFEEGIAMLELARQSLKYAAEKNARYAFTLAPVSLARNYQQAAYLLGLEWQTRNDVQMPQNDEDDVRMNLAVLDLAPVSRAKASTADARELVAAH